MAVQVLTALALATAWPALDRFEGPEYQRILVPVFSAAPGGRAAALHGRLPLRHGRGQSRHWEKVTSTFEASAKVGALGSHQFLDNFALAYHLAVAERLRERPDIVIERARQNLNRWLEGEAFGPGARQSVEEWQKILDGSGVRRLIQIITDPSDEGQRLRSSSPLVSTLTPEERLEILAACEQRATA